MELAQGDHDGHEHRTGYGDDPACAAHREQADGKHEQVGDDEGGKDAVDRDGMLHKQERAGGKALDHQRAEHDGGDDVAGHAERQQRNERSQNDYSIFYTSPIACLILGVSLIVLLKPLVDDFRAGRKAAA